MTGIEESAGRSSGGRRPRRAAPARSPSAATIAPLSVHSPGRGTRSRMPAASQRSSASARSRELAATPPPISRWSTPCSRAGERPPCGSARRRRPPGRRPRRRRPAPARPSRSRGLDPAGDRGLEAGEGEVVAVRSQVARAGQPARERRSHAGSPLARHRGRCADRRGTAARARRATLSKASPAASSMVAPERPHVTGDVRRPAAATSARRTPAARCVGSGSGPCSSWSTATWAARWLTPYSGLPSAERERLGGRDADQQRAGEPGPARDRDARRRPRSRTPASCRRARSSGTIASRCARLATSGTTPPNRACSSTLDATASASRVVPRTIPTPVSSQDVSMPRTSGSSAIARTHPSRLSRECA